MKHFYLVVFYCLFFCGVAFSQTAGKLIDVNFQQAGVEQVVTSLEAKTGYRFYYDPALFDSLRVTIQVSQQPLTSVLDLVFKNTDFHYAITTQHEVLLSKGREVQTDLAAQLFGSKPKPRKTTVPIKSFAVDEKEKTIVEATIENKIYDIGFRTNTGGSATIAGYVKDIKTGAPITGAILYVPDIKTGANTDEFGFYSLTMLKGKHVITIRSVGAKDTRRQINLYSDGKLSIDLQEQIQTLKEVTISADKIANVKSTQLGIARLDIKSIKEIPAVFGEADVLRALLVIPGVQSVGEATTGFNVRGGAADQNLVLLDGLTIYNPAHFFGFFSAFNPDVVKDVELYKSTVPERFGGRLSSVLEVTNREGNKKKFTGSAGIGLLTSRLNIEGPLVKDKTSFNFGGRTTYSDWLLKLLPEAYKHSTAQFYDFNFDLSHQINDKNSLYLYTYLSNDKFKLNSDTTYNYSNKNIALKWKHNYNNKLYSVITGGLDRYQYGVGSPGNPVNAYQLNFDISQTNFKTDFTYYHNTQHTLTFGLSAIYYKLHPGNLQPDGIKSLVLPNVVPQQQGLESALYLGDKFDVNNDLSISGGIRLSTYSVLGPGAFRNYAAGLPKDPGNVVDSVNYKNSQFVKTYINPEIRLAVGYNVGDNLSVKAGYTSLHQYLHLLSNSVAISPTDIYQLTDNNVRPQNSQQISLGLYRNLQANTIETSVEVYYKKIGNYLDYRSGATLTLNHHIETDVINTQGKAYGVELMVRKTAGKLTGIMSYTYSRTFLKQDDPAVLPYINGGAYYPANYDKPHDFNFTGSYHISHRYSVQLNLVYSTGRPITLPIAKYIYDGSERVYYSDRNQYRIPDYFRSDFSLNILPNHVIKKTTHNSWTVGVYNLTGAQNAYSTYFSQQGGVISGYKLSIFAAPIPFINYNLTF
ncbi:MAG: TonB-dependent receptor [Mucilaginibacter sp.]|nr:TonB-dependent receptor [Mucilaginibacter sp.]